MINGGVDTLGVPLNNSGTVASTNGAFYLSGPVANSGTLVANGGFLEIQGGTLGGTIEALSNNAALVGTYSVAANTIDTVTFESAYLGWGGDGEAVFAGPGTVVSNGFVYVHQYNGAATQLQLTDGVTWYNAGFVQQEGGVEFGGSTTDTATIVNQAGATYLLNGGNAQITDDAGGTYNFVNDGLLEMNAGGNDTIAVPLDNSGTVESTNGALYLSGPVTNSGTLLADGGFLEDQGGTLGGTIEAISNNLGLVGTYSVAAGTTDTVTFGERLSRLGRRRRSGVRRPGHHAQQRFRLRQPIQRRRDSVAAYRRCHLGQRRHGAAGRRRGVRRIHHRYRDDRQPGRRHLPAGWRQRPDRRRCRRHLRFRQRRPAGNVCRRRQLAVGAARQQRHCRIDQRQLSTCQARSPTAARCSPMVASSR